MGIVSWNHALRGFAALVVASWIQLVAIAPAQAIEVPTPVLELSSAGAGVGGTLLSSSGQPVLDSAGRAIQVSGIQTQAATLTAQAIADMLRVPEADLFTYVGQVGGQVPPAMAGTLTLVTRSDGGVEAVFQLKAPDGSAMVFLADRTGTNVYGVRVAKVAPSGETLLFTAHGLNGNFTSPPWYLSAQAKAQYWTQMSTARLSALVVPPTVVTRPVPVPAPATSSTLNALRSASNPRGFNVYHSALTPSAGVVTLDSLYGGLRRERR